MEKNIIFIETERKSYNLEANLKIFIDKTKNEYSNKNKKYLKISSISVNAADEDCEEGRNEGEIVVNHYDFNSISEFSCSEQNTSHNTSKDADFIYDDYYKISEALHEEANKFGDAGAYVTYIIICVHNYLPQLSEIPEFFGALRRIEEWHRGLVFISTTYSDIPTDWSALLHLSVVQSADLLVNPILDTFWRGNLELTVEGERECHVLPEMILRCAYGNPIFSGDSKQEYENIYLDSNGEIITQVDIGSVPWPYIRPGSVYKLSASSNLDKDESRDVEDLFNLINSNAGIGTLFRIKYSPEPPVLEDVTDLTTDEWKKCLAEGQFDATPTLNFKGVYHVLNFLILTEGTSDTELLVVPLQDITSCGDDIIKLLMNESTNKEEDLNEEDDKKILQLMESTQCMTSLNIAVLSHLSLDLPIQIRDMLEKKGQNIQNLWEDTKCDLEKVTSKEVLKYISLAPMKKVKLDNNIKDTIPEINLDKDNWPEYQSLLYEEEKRKGSFKRNFSGEMLGGLAPPVKSDAAITLDVTSFLQMFKPNGQPTDKVKAKMTKYVKCGDQYPFKSTTSIKEARDRKWPDCFHTKHHGILYNTDAKMEKFEEQCNKFRDRYVTNDTASTCTLFSDKGTLFTIPKKKSESKKDLDAKPTETRKSPRKLNRKIESDMDTASMKSGQYSNPARRLSSRINCENKLRRSPRKSAALNNSAEMKPSDLLRPSDKTSSSKPSKLVAKKVPVNANLSDLHKQKLRIAVVNSLESEGMKMKDKLFKVCFKKLFEVCRPFALDIIGCGGSTSKNFENIAQSHVKQVIDFENLKFNKRPRR